MQLNEKLRELRTDMGKTQQEVAKAIYVSRGAYLKYELGQQLPDIYTLKRIADFFDETIDYLIDEDY